MYVFFEDGGNFKAEKVFSKAESSLQVESQTGRRSKIKSANVLFEFNSPSPTELMSQAQTIAEGLDISFLWECSPQEDIEAIEIAQEYFGHQPSAVEHAALIFALQGAPAYFHRRGKGRYRPAPPEILEAALAAIEKREQQAKQQQAWIDQMVAGTLPEELSTAALSFITNPDKNTLEWKAFEAAVNQLNTTPEKLLLDLNVLPHPLALHQHKFLATHFPKGTDYPNIKVGTIRADMPLANVTAYTLDDSQTTEFDDALSVQIIDASTVRIGIHIAVPALAVIPGGELDNLARKRMSTIYMPGHKIPMLSDNVIEAFSLVAGKIRPALSLYVTTDLTTGDIKNTETILENITVNENLYHKDLESLATEQALEDQSIKLPYGDWLRPLWQASRHFSRQRDLVRGRPENNNRTDFIFELEGPHTDPDTLVKLTPRMRNSPLDKMIAEYMILANNIWGGLLDQRGLPGIYRSQQASRVRMTTHALPHDAIGVPYYAWSTSPLRRYIDLINQSQIIAAAEHGVSARLAAPFKQKDADLFSIISAFDAQHSAWNEQQSRMERYWCLRWLQQQGYSIVQASVLRDTLVRLNNAPLVVKVPGLPELDRGQIIELDILGFDEVNLELNCRLREIPTQ